MTFSTFWGIFTTQSLSLKRDKIYLTTFTVDHKCMLSTSSSTIPYYQGASIFFQELDCPHLKTEIVQLPTLKNLFLICLFVLWKICFGGLGFYILNLPMLNLWMTIKTISMEMRNKRLFWKLSTFAFLLFNSSVYSWYMGYSGLPLNRDFPALGHTQDIVWSLSG